MINATNRRSKDPPSAAVLFALPEVESAAQAVCKARANVSKLGDIKTCQELDRICKSVAVIKDLTEKTYEGLGGMALAKVFIEQVGVVKRLREDLLSKTRSPSQRLTSD